MLRTTCPFNLTALMNAHKVTIRELAKRMNVPMTRVREVRRMNRVSYMNYCDYTEAVTGQSVFSPARFHAMDRQSRTA